MQGTLTATILTAAGGNFENLAIDPATVTTTVDDTIDTTTVSLSAAANVVEGSGSLTYTATLTNAAHGRGDGAPGQRPDDHDCRWGYAGHDDGGGARRRSVP